MNLPYGLVGCWINSNDDVFFGIPLVAHDRHLAAKSG